MPDSDPAQASLEIIAALVWDVPTLRAGSESAQNFVKALEGELEKWWEPRQYADDALGRAAQAVAFERGGEGREARPAYDELAAADQPWVQLLGLMLSAWSESGDGTEAATRAYDAAERIEAEDELRARLQAKVATFALDSGQHGLAQKALARAVELAPPASRLHSRLALEAFNAGIRRPDTDAFGTAGQPFEQDPLVDYPWIQYSALEAARSGLSAQVERDAERLWNWTLKFGGTTPLDGAVSAEVQATWAGALWLRRQLRVQLGAQLLRREAAHSQQWAYGVLMWALGGGKNPEQVYELAEPHLDQDGVDFIVRHLHDADWPRGLSHRFVSVASQAWDSLSVETLRWLVAMLEPSASEHPALQEVNRLWSGFAARLPGEWEVRIRDESAEVQLALLSTVGLPTIERLSAETKDRLGHLLVDQLASEEHPDPHLLRLAVELMPSDRREQMGRMIAERATAEGLAEIGSASDLVSHALLQRKRDELLANLAAEGAKARQGSVGFGPRDTRLTLARLLLALPHDPEAIAVLAEVGRDAELPGEHILAARNGLALLRHAGLLAEDQIAAWHHAPDPVGTFPEHGGTKEELVRIRRLQILALELTSDEAVEVISATRSTDRRVRVLAIEICKEAAEVTEARGEREPFVWALVGGLWDPQDSVAASAVWALGDEVGRDSSAALVALDRLPRLYDIGNTRVRTAIAEIAARLGDTAPVPIQRLLRTAMRDKSWRVRRAADTDPSP